MSKLKKTKLIFISIFIILINDVHSQSLSQEYKQNDLAEQRLIEKGAYYKKIAKIWLCERNERDVYGNHVYTQYLTIVNNKAFVGENIINERSLRYVALEVDKWSTFTEKNKIIEISSPLLGSIYRKIEFNLNTLQMYAKATKIDIYQCREIL